LTKLPLRTSRRMRRISVLVSAVMMREPPFSAPNSAVFEIASRIPAMPRSAIRSASNFTSVRHSK